MAFKRGDQVFVKQGNAEVSATFQEYIHDLDGKPPSAYVYLNGKQEQVDAENVLAPRKPGFGIRDLVSRLRNSEAVATSLPDVDFFPDGIIWRCRVAQLEGPFGDG